MKRLLILAALMLLWTASASAQTTVNLTVIDTPDNQTWNNGTWQVQLIPPPGNSSQTRSFTLTGGGSLSNQSGSLSSTGTASMTLPANVNIAPAGTLWQFYVCSQSATACWISNVTVVTSSPQTLNINPPSIRIAAIPNLPPVVVYTTTEISSAALGSQITLVGSTPSTPALQSCTAVSGSTCTTWASSSGGGSSGASLPATCTPGTTANFRLTVAPYTEYFCIATNTWAQVGQAPALILDPTTPSVGGQAQPIQTASGGQNSVNPLPFAFLYPTSQGHTYLGLVRWTTGAITFTNATTTQGDTCTQIGTTQANGENVAAFICSNVTGGAATTVNVNFSAAPAFSAGSVTELTPSTVDAFATASGNSTSIVTGNLTTTAFPQETLFLLAGLASGVTISPAAAYNGVIPPGPVANIPLGFVTVAGVAGGGSVSVAEAGNTTAIGTYNVTATNISPSQQWVSFFIAMKGTPATPINFAGNSSGPVNLGTITGPLTPVQFQVSNGQASYPSGQVNITVTSGSIINGGFALTASLDGGNTWFGVPCDTSRFSTVTGSDPTPIYSAQCSVVGLAGAILRFGPFQGYGISNLVVWAGIG